MPSMSRVEQAFCRSVPWRAFAQHVVLPWALQGSELVGDYLELGCGSGAMAEGAARTFGDARVTATDIDPAMVVAARIRLEAYDNVTVAQADVTALPFETASFDSVASYLMLHHVIQWRAALAEVERVLRPGGLFVGYDLHASRPAEWVHVVDRSPHCLIPSGEFAPALAATGFTEVSRNRAFGGLLTRFTARKPAGV